MPLVSLTLFLAYLSDHRPLQNDYQELQESGVVLIALIMSPLYFD